jgi:DNA-binding MarR family transcriptional regulator
VDSELTTQQALNAWRDALVRSVRGDGPDLSSRQMSLLLTVYLVSDQHTVRGLAGILGISKPAVTRAVDALSTLGFLRRAPDPRDKRSVLVQRTVKGSVFLSEFAESVTESISAVS